MKKILLLLLLFITTIVLGQNGKVGIGTTTPQETLHVAGDTSTIRIDGLNSINNDGNDGTVTNVSVDTNGTLILTPKIMGKVARDGINVKVVGASVTKIGRGTYQVTFTTPMLDSDYLILLTKKRLNQNGYDDPNIGYYDQEPEGFKVEIENGDNGFIPGDEIDLEFMFKVEKID